MNNRHIILWDVTPCSEFYLLLASCWLLGLLSDPEDWGSIFLRNFGELPDYTTSHPRRQYSSQAHGVTATLTRSVSRLMGSVQLQEANTQHLSCFVLRFYEISSIYTLRCAVQTTRFYKSSVTMYCYWLTSLVSLYHRHRRNCMKGLSDAFIRGRNKDRIYRHRTSEVPKGPSSLLCPLYSSNRATFGMMQGRLIHSLCHHQLQILGLYPVRPSQFVEAIFS
jgi:hypothetical protein